MSVMNSERTILTTVNALLFPAMAPIVLLGMSGHGHAATLLVAMALFGRALVAGVLLVVIFQSAPRLGIWMRSTVFGAVVSAGLMSRSRKKTWRQAFVRGTAVPKLNCPDGG